jgi:UDP-N-acetylglucosamine acyltransferase
MPHVVISGRTRIGAGARIFPFASIGHQPQDLKYEGEPSELIVGDNVTIREYVTMNPGTRGGGMITRVGDDCVFMAGAHVAHDCQVGNHVILANNASLSGHVEVGDWAMIGGMSAVDSDVIPYGSVMGDRAYLSGLNIIGLKRRDFSREAIHDLRAAYRLLFAQEGTLQERVEDVAELFPDNLPVRDVVEFISNENSRALCQPRQNRDG